MDKRLVLLLASWVLAAWTFGQQPTVTLRADTSAIMFGGQTWIHLEALRDPASGASNLAWVTWKDTLPGGWEILETKPTDTALVALENGQDGIAISQSMRVTIWDSGVVRMPELPVLAGNDTLFSNALLFSVRGPQLGAEGQIADFADIIEVKWTLWERLQRAFPYVLVMLLIASIAAGIVLAIKRFKRRERPLQAVPSAPSEPADVIALRDLRAIQDRAVYKQGDVKRHHSEISDVLRTYLVNRFGFNASEQTTREIHQHLSAQPMPADLRNLFIEVLELADLVKFAKFRGETADHERAVMRAIQCVEHTRPVEAENPSEA